MELKEQFFQLTQERFGRAPDQCGDQQLYEALLLLARRMSEERPAPEGERKLYYFSAEFLLGKLLTNHLLALGLYDQVDELLRQWGHSLAEVVQGGPEPTRGNAGPGRRAAGEDQLRGHPGKPAGERAVRIRSRRVHRCPGGGQAGQV